MRYLGIDFGHKKMGLALSDEQGDFVYPHSVIKNDKNSILIIADLCHKEGVAEVVIGDTHDLKGSDNLVTKQAKDFAKNLIQLLKLPINWQTEVFSSREAERTIGDDELRDARAAAIILQSYLDRKRFAR